MKWVRIDTVLVYECDVWNHIRNLSKRNNKYRGKIIKFWSCDQNDENKRIHYLMGFGYLRFRKLTFEVKLVLKFEKFSVLAFSWKNKFRIINLVNWVQLLCWIEQNVIGRNTYLRGANSPTADVYYCANIDETSPKWNDSPLYGCFRSKFKRELSELQWELMESINNLNAARTRRSAGCLFALIPLYLLKKQNEIVF